VAVRLLPASTGLGWTPYIWLVYLVYLVIFPYLGRGPSYAWYATAAAVAIFLPLYFYGYWLAGRKLLPVVIAIAAIGAVLTPINLGGSVFFIYAAAFLGETGPPRVAAVRLAVLMVLMMAEGLALEWPARVWLPVFVVCGIVGGANIHFAEVRRKDAVLRVAHRAVEEMARIAERERIGRDLHDLLGHTLSVIVLKAELASRLADRDTARAIAEIRDVERISRDALAEVRKAVRGYRGESLKDEVVSAERVLEAAGIAATIDITDTQLPPDEDRALAYALREAVTNVVRHAEATACEIRLGTRGGRTVLEIRDNGRGGLTPEGSGLSGIRERLRQVAGTLERDGREGTRLVMSLPAHRSAS
jgi:two-component system sensor histidine kinase DesK